MVERRYLDGEQIVLIHVRYVFAFILT